MQNEKALSFYKITDECVIHLVAKSLEEVNSNNTNDANNQNNLNNQQVNKKLKYEIKNEEIIIDYAADACVLWHSRAKACHTPARNGPMKAWMLS